MTEKADNPYAKIDEAFFADGYQLAVENLSEKPDEVSLLAHLKRQYEIIDGLLEAFHRRIIKNGNGIDCKSGCSWCCYQQVLAMPAEMLLMANYVRENFDTDTLDEIYQRTVEKDENVKSLPPEKVLRSKIPCPLLRDGVCSVYPVRPMACRIYLSSSLESCVSEFSHPDKPEVYPMLFDFPLHAGRMMNGGLIHYLKEKGIPVYENRLELLLRMMLEEKGKGTRWLNGEIDFSDGIDLVEAIIKLREAI